MPIFNFVLKLIKNADPVIIIPFGGYANEDSFVSCARVLEDEGIRHHEDDHKIKNLWNSLKRFESDEIKGARVRVSWQNKSIIKTTDDEGYIYIEEKHGLANATDGMTHIPVTFELLEKGEVVYQTTSNVIRPHKDAKFGVISDVDDTIIHTGVASTLKWRVLVNVLFRHSDKRLPLEGAEEFYRKLHLGKSGQDNNPIFYLSNSPWNIFEYLTSFLNKFEFPEGPLLLRDIDSKFLKKSGFETGHKYVTIVKILQMYPHLSFILIGDAGEIDIDIYISIANSHPDRIKCIYIRSVSKESKNERIREQIIANPALEISLVHDKSEVLAHAREYGYIE